MTSSSIKVYTGIVFIGVTAIAGWYLGKLAKKSKSKHNAIDVNAKLEQLTNKFPQISATADTLGIQLEASAYIDILGKLVGVGNNLQNFPPEFVPQETLAAGIVIDVLEPYSTKNGGPLEIQRHEFQKGHTNLIIKYPGTAGPDGPTLGLVGSHLDVVPAVPDNWERDPFKLVVEGDKLYGRGTTDCLGHIALQTLFLAELAKSKPKITPNIMVVFIASEECEAQPGVGVDGLADAGLLDPLKNGNTLWVDASDSEPCIGCASAVMWHLTATGKRFHSGLPHLGINPIELASEALVEIQEKFYERYPPHPLESCYQFNTSSTMKPTQISCAKGGLNQIPSHMTISGDVRMTPFYSPKDAVDYLTSVVKTMNETKFADLPTRGPWSKYSLPAENRVGLLELKFENSALMEGIACDIDSAAFLAFCDACKTIRGSCKPYSLCGSLPLVKMMQNQGIDLMITGFGRMEVYHAENEFCYLSEMLQAARILSLYVSKMDKYYSQRS